MILQKIDWENVHFFGTGSVNLNLGMTVITGETGAGKSLFLKMLAASLGHRRVHIHPQILENPAYIQSLFTDSAQQTWQATQSLAPLSTWKLEHKGRKQPKGRDIVSTWVQWHGQGDHFSQHDIIDILDHFIDDQEIFHTVQQAYEKWKAAERHYKHVQEHADHHKAQQTLYQYQYIGFIMVVYNQMFTEQTGIIPLFVSIGHFKTVSSSPVFIIIGYP